MQPRAGDAGIRVRLPKRHLLPLADDIVSDPPVAHECENGRDHRCDGREADDEAAANPEQSPTAFCDQRVLTMVARR